MPSILIALVLLALGVTAEAQQPAKVAKIGWLGALPAASDTGSELFARELRKLGYVEGKNIGFEYRYAENQLDRLPALADELVHLKVNVIVTPSDSQALAAKNATRTIPIVFYSVGDPVGLGLVDSLARAKHYRVRHHGVSVGWQTAGVAQGNCSQTQPRCIVVESRGSEL